MPSKNRISAAVGAVTRAPALLITAALAFSPAAWALGLGEATVQSYLNQPLQAKIDLISQATDDLTSVTAQLASAADYELIGADRESVSVPIAFSIEDIDGDAYIHATSRLPINDPVLRLIVEVNWANGRLLREYTLFLDPPTVPAQAPIPRVEQRQAPPPPVAAPAPTPAPEPTAAAPEASAPPAARPAAAAVAGGQEYGPVRSGETLWGIASDWSRGSGLDINRVMIAIQQQNPDAFLNDNINLLKRGAILRMPTAADIERISTSSAYREVASQEAEFSGRSAADTMASPETPLIAEESAAMERERAEETPAPAEAGETAATAEDVDSTAADAAPEGEAELDEAAELAGQSPDQEEPAEAVPDTRDQLELVPPVEDSLLASASGFEEAVAEGEAGASVQALQENLARTEEELITQQQQNAYLEERIRELEEQLQSAGTGQVADADLANMEDRLREQRQQQPAAADERPWYTRGMVWLIGLLVLIAAFIGWLISRRGGDEEAAESLEDIKSEAEDLLRMLSDAPAGKEDSKEDTASQPAVEARSAGEGEPEEGGADEPEGGEAEPGRAISAEDDAEILDEESSDPEIQLDLARAYISMGDKEAARVILEEVVANGSEEQEAEARKMLELLD
jgi:pilus assembly protein FimV